jgi:hypothetical protein
MLPTQMRGSNVRLVVSLIVASTLGAALLYTTVLGGTVDVVQHDPATARSITFVYHGAVPSAFRDGRAILVDGRVKGATFDARSDSLSTKCPSKYSSTSVAPTQ